MDFGLANVLGVGYRGGEACWAPGDRVLAPVGSRVAELDLKAGAQRALRLEHRRPVRRVLVQPPGGAVALTVDETGHVALANLARQVVLHRFSLKGPAGAAAFAPDGRAFAVGVGKVLQIWETPATTPAAAAADGPGGEDGPGTREPKRFMPFRLLAAYGTCHAPITSVEWSPDGRFLAAGSEDLACHVFSRAKLEGYKAATLTAHRTPLVGACFGRRGDRLYTVSEDGALALWRHRGPADDPAWEPGDLARGRWELEGKEFFRKNETRTTCCAVHRGSGLLVAGFSSGVFELYQLPPDGDFQALQALSISREPITTVAFNGSGEWILAGVARLGQLLVWEWRSETYVFKQQAHLYDVAAMDFSPDGALLVTGADDAKVKLWNARTGQCVVTFAEHAAPVSAALFLPAGNAVASASLDGTVRAFDLVRYRNFRTFAPPEPAQLGCLAVDQGGEILAAGSLDTFQLFLWSMKTGKLLDVFSGHEGPVSAAEFSPLGDALASSSWDKTVRLWDTFTGQSRVEALEHGHDVLALAFHPGGKRLASATLNGSVYFWDAISCDCEGVLDGRLDVKGGRLSTDRRTVEGSSAGQHFTCLAFSPDGATLFAAGNTKWVCVYDAGERTLLHRVQVSHNLNLDGVRDELSSRAMTAAGPVDLIDAEDSDEDPEAKRGGVRRPGGASLPGTGVRRRPAVKVRSVRVARTGRTWAAATGEGVLVFAKDEGLVFDPFGLDEAVTPAAVHRAHRAGEHLKALAMAIRLKDKEVVWLVMQGVPLDAVPIAARSVPRAQLGWFLGALAERLESSPHLEWHLDWCKVSARGTRADGWALLTGLRPPPTPRRCTSRTAAFCRRGGRRWCRRSGPCRRRWARRTRTCGRPCSGTATGSSSCSTRASCARERRRRARRGGGGGARPAETRVGVRCGIVAHHSAPRGDGAEEGGA